MRNLFGLAALSWLLSASGAGARNLEMYFVDVEGGQATLIVSPAGESLLVDAGWPGFDGRDAARIEATAKLAGVRQIDYLLVTHYHTDHVGGVPPLAERMPVVRFLDHGPNTETGKNAATLSAAYEQAVKKGKRLVVKLGDRIPVRGLDIRVLTARGERIRSPLKGAGAPNPACQGVQPIADNKTENPLSVGFLLTYGKFRFIDLADLTWNKELDLVCPNNLIGAVDVYLVNHHGMDISNSPALVHGLRPRVAIMNNGAKKGGSPAAWQVIRKSPGLEDLWQLHFSLAGGKENNSAEELIANLDEKCQGHWIKLVAERSGAFTVTNGRNGFSKKYPAR